MCYVCHYDSRGGTNNACMSVQNLDKVAGCAYCLVSHAVHGWYFNSYNANIFCINHGSQKVFLISNNKKMSGLFPINFNTCFVSHPMKIKFLCGPFTTNHNFKLVKHTLLKCRENIGQFCYFNTDSILKNCDLT